MKLPKGNFILIIYIHSEGMKRKNMKGENMKDIVILTNRLTKAFSGKEVIRNCQMSVEQGTIYGFLGRNGAGKTTVFKLLLGLLRPSAGKACLLGMSSVNDRETILRRTGSLIETPVFYEHLSATDNLLLHLAYMGVEDVKAEPTLQRVGLTDTGKQPVSTFSLGMRQRLAIARALIHKPEILILDEPVNGLDPVGMKEMRELFRRLVDEEGMTILLSSHLLFEIEQITDRIGVIVDGTIVQEMDIEEIREKYPSGMEDYFMAAINGGVDNE